MKITETSLAGVFLLAPEPHRDERGFFARVFCENELKQAKITFRSVQVNLSRNPHPYTLRGLHYQDSPYAEAKIVRVTAGRIFDVVVDIRKESANYLKHVCVQLDSNTANGLYIPEGFAHGFMSLEPNTDVLYQMGRPYVAGHAKGLRWDDPALRIEWPARPHVISNDDQLFSLIN